MKISVCIPMYNEEKIAADTAQTVWTAMDQLRRENGWEFEVIFADDGSADACAECVVRRAEEMNLDGVRVVGYGENRGKGAAVREAVLSSVGDIVLYTDCDLAYGTDVIGEAVRRYTDETDAVIGSRRLSSDGYEGYTLIRKIASKIYIRMLGILGGFRLSDSQCGFKSFRGDLARMIFAKCQTNGFAFDFEVLMLAAKRNAHISEMPVRIINHRESKVNVLRDSVRMLRDLMRIKRYVRTVTWD